MLWGTIFLVCHSNVIVNLSVAFPAFFSPLHFIEAIHLDRLTCSKEGSSGWSKFIKVLSSLLLYREFWSKAFNITAYLFLQHHMVLFFFFLINLQQCLPRKYQNWLLHVITTRFNSWYINFEWSSEVTDPCGLMDLISFLSLDMNEELFSTDCSWWPSRTLRERTFRIMWLPGQWQNVDLDDWA